MTPSPMPVDKFANEWTIPIIAYKDNLADYYNKNGWHLIVLQATKEKEELQLVLFS